MKSIFLSDSQNCEIEVKLEESFNKGNPYSNLLIDSVKNLGVARSVVVDANNTIICGHKILEAAVELGIKKTIVVPTIGDTIVIVKRIDIANNTKKKYDLQLVDNLVATKNIKYDSDAILNKMKADVGFDARMWGGHECIVKDLDISSLLKDEILQKENNNLQQLSLF